MSSRGVFKRKLYAAKNKFLMDIEVTYMAKNFQNLKQILKDYLWTKKIRFGFPHFLFVQIEFLHAHVTQDPSLPDVFYCSLIDWLNQASPLDQSTVNKDLYHIYHIYQWNKNRDVLLEKYCCSFGFCPIEGGWGPCPNFFIHFQEVHFWSIKEPITSKLPIIWT